MSTEEGISSSNTDAADGLAMTDDQIVKNIIERVKELYSLKKQRALEEQERDLFFRQLEVARDELVQNEARFLSTHKDIDKVKESQHLEQKVNQQRARHLRYEQSREIEVEERAQDRVSLALATATARKREELRAQAERLQKETTEERRAAAQSIKELSHKLDLESQEVRQNFVEALEDRRQYFRREREEAWEEAATDLETCCRKADQHRLTSMHHLQVNFERNFHDVKRYYQELTYHNLSLIQDLRGQSSAVKQHINNLAQRLRETQARNKRFHQPMQKRQQQLGELRKQVELFSKDQAAFARVNREITLLKNERTTLQREIAELESECQMLQANVKSSRANYVSAAEEAKHIVGLEASMVRNKTFHLNRELSRLKAEIRHMASQGHIPAEEALDHIEMLEQECLKNLTLKNDLKQSVTKMTKVYNDTLKTIRCLNEDFYLDLDIPAISQDLKMDNQLAGKPAEVLRSRKQKG
ncbi:hypothetical protein RvY_13776 [Ramazzottius varieornatus]|uniref:Dynein regulatory complex subunit 4 n=1 Tax=Ramazzottius varieornatus TaxID=947166 RepID=A0A1D1VP28_RAMVA|nr:hypothetical protein RvY_13776 [Ramazzottius varieornatus]